MQGLQKKSSRSLLSVNEGGFFECNAAVARYLSFMSIWTSRTNDK